MTDCYNVVVDVTCERINAPIATTNTIPDQFSGSGTPYVIELHLNQRMSEYFSFTQGVTWTVNKTPDISDIDTIVDVLTDENLLKIDGWVWPVDLTGWSITATDQYGNQATSNTFSFTGDQ